MFDLLKFFKQVKRKEPNINVVGNLIVISDSLSRIWLYPTGASCLAYKLVFISRNLPKKEGISYIPARAELAVYAQIFKDYSEIYNLMTKHAELCTKIQIGNSLSLSYQQELLKSLTGY